MNKLVKHFVFLLVLLPSLAQAGEWTPIEKIERIYTKSDGTTYIDFYGPSSNPDVCNRTGYYILKTGAAGFDALYSLLLAAKFSERDARVYVSGCDSEYPKIHHVMAY